MQIEDGQECHEKTLQLTHRPVSTNITAEGDGVHFDFQSDCFGGVIWVHFIYIQMQELDVVYPFKPRNRLMSIFLENKLHAPSASFRKTFICFAVCAVILLSFSIYFFVLIGGITEYTEQYTNLPQSACSVGSQCRVKFEGSCLCIVSDLGNVSKSSSIYTVQEQCAARGYYPYYLGNAIEIDEASLCSPYITNAQMNATVSWAGVALDPKAVASPCGAIGNRPLIAARTNFTDTFFLLDGNNQNVSINQVGISWPGDKGSKYKRGPNSASTQWIDPENEHFIVWMRTSGLPNFKKLWGRIETDIPAGTYTMVINNSFTLEGWTGSKYFILTTSSAIGGRNYVLPVAYLILGILALGVITVLWLKQRQLKAD